MTEDAAIVIIFADKSNPVVSWYKETYVNKLIDN